MDFEIPLLKALLNLGGKARPAETYPEVEKTMGLNRKDFPEEYEKYKSDVVKWKNKTAWAREYLQKLTGSGHAEVPDMKRLLMILASKIRL